MLGLLCTGAGNDAIAERLGVSRHTIRNHVAASYDKIGVHSRGAAIVWARDRGLMTHAHRKSGTSKQMLPSK